MSSSTHHTATLQALDARHHLHPFSDNGALAKKGTRIITRGEGVYIWDSEGHQLLDGFAGLWCVNIGYGRRELIDAAAKQMQELPYYNSFFQCTTPPAIALAEAICDVAPAHMNHVFFVGSGSEANDTIFRMVRHFWAVQGQPQRHVFIGRVNGYHGSTVAGASLGGMKPMHEQGGLPIPGVEHIGQPYWFGEGRDLTPDEFGLRVARQLEQKIEAIGADKVAAFIAEPIQGAGGVIIPPDTYWPEINRICEKYGILLIADEVICGFGRTGNWFGSDTFGIKADLMPIAKGMSSGYLPIGGVMVGDRVAKVMKELGGEFVHGYTYSGHPVCAAVALENIRILRDENIVERVGKETGPYLNARLQELADHPLVGEVRSVGLIGGIELVASKQPLRLFADKGKVGVICRDHALDCGLVLRATGDTMLLSPPLVMTKAQIDELIDKTRLALDMTLASLARSPLS